MAAVPGAPVKALNMFKDEYLLDFINTEEIGIRDIQDIDELVVEKEIIHNIKKFIMTFGRDFAFVGNQYHLEALPTPPHKHPAVMAKTTVGTNSGATER